MARTRRPRMSWFRFYVDDFAGGIAALTAADVGAYVLLLMAQWASKEEQSVPSDQETLLAICKGVAPSPRVLSKFAQMPNGLRNQRLAMEWRLAKAEFDGKKGDRKGDVTPADTAQESPTKGPKNRPPSKTQDPRSRDRERSAEASSATLSKAPWSRQACDDWNERYGPGTAPGQRIGGGLKRLVDENGWEKVRPAWRRYLFETGHPSPSAQDFAQHFADWLPGGKGSTRGGPVREDVATVSRRVLGLPERDQTAGPDLWTEGVKP